MDKLKYASYDLVSSKDGHTVGTVLSAYEHPSEFIMGNYGISYMDVFGEELILKNPTIDTISAVSRISGAVYPKFVKIPSNRGKEESHCTWLDYGFETNRFAGLLLYNFDTKFRFLLVDKENGQVYESRMANDDMKENSWGYISPGRAYSRAEKNVIAYPYDAYVLMDLYAKGLLKGQLAELASTLNENDNPILLIAEFR